MLATDPSLLKLLLTRRGALRLGLGVGGAVLLLGGAGAFVFRAKPPAAGLAVLSDDERETVRALADAYFPADTPTGVPANDVDIAGRVDAYVARLLPREQRLLRALLTLVEQWPRATLAGRFSALPTAARVEIVDAWERGIEQRQQLASVFRTLVGVAYFDEPRVLRAIGHRFGCLPVVPS